MKLVKSYLTNNPCYKANKKIAVKGLMLHSIGCSQPNAQVFINSWNKSTYDSACVHGFIDANNGIIYQTLPWDHRGWHAGGSANNTHIGVEMCEPSCIKYSGGAKFTCTDLAKARNSVSTTYNAAVELFAYLCAEYNLDPMKDICSHKEGGKKGIASGHVDPEHLWSGLGLSYTMDTFRQAVKNTMQNNAPNTPENVQKEAEKVQNQSKNASKIAFIEQIATFVNKYRNKYNIAVASPIIAQACLESAYGTSELAQKHNYFGLKYRKDRCPTSSGFYMKMGSEQNADGSYTDSNMTWFTFENMEQGVIGYFDFTNIANYKNLKGVKDPKKYLENIKADGYATSLKYVDNVMAVIKEWNLTQYDDAQQAAVSSEPVYYTVKKGDTLSKIAKAYGTTAKAIQQLNPTKIKNINIIQIGWKIRVK